MSSKWSDKIIPASKILTIEVEALEKALAVLGVEPGDEGVVMLESEEITPFGDLRRVLVDEGPKVGIAKLRSAIKHFRGEASAKKDETVDVARKLGIPLESLVMLAGNTGDLNIADLVDVFILLRNYNPAKQDMVSKILKAKFNGKKVIAFKPDSTVVAEEETAEYIADLENGYPAKESLEVAGELVPLYPVGIIPNNLVDEDPFFPGRPLRRGRSDEAGRFDWGAVPLQDRQLARVIMQKERLSREAARNLYKFLRDGGFSDVKELYAEAYMEFKRLKAKDELPKLRLELQAVSRVADPFGVR